jgi:hypothetical protein
MFRLGLQASDDTVSQGACGCAATGSREPRRCASRPSGFESLAQGSHEPLAGGSRSRVPPIGGAMLTLLRLPFSPVSALHSPVCRLRRRYAHADRVPSSFRIGWLRQRFYFAEGLRSSRAQGIQTLRAASACLPLVRVARADPRRSAFGACLRLLSPALPTGGGALPCRWPLKPRRSPSRSRRGDDSPPPLRIEDVHSPG